MTDLSIIVLLKGKRKHLKQGKARSHEVVMFLGVMNSGLYLSADPSQVALSGPVYSSVKKERVLLTYLTGML